MREKLTIGLFGFGCVGKGLYDVLSLSKGLQTDIKRICVKDKNKQRPIPNEHFTFNKYELLDDPEINVIVELIDDADAAFEIVKYAMQKGKAVVSANKKMIAEHFDELLALQREYKVPFLYEAAACASIPVIRNLEEYYDNDLLNSIEGIVNGSTNYILTKLYNEGSSYAEVLAEAQKLGFAESDPLLDVGGYDARYKLCLLALHAFGAFVEPEKVFKYGIQNISKADIQYAKEKGSKIKLVAHARKEADELHLWVAPQLIPNKHSLYAIDNEYNGVLIEGVFSDKQFFTGKGAGSYPTASAVLSDISALSYRYCYEYKKTLRGDTLTFTGDISIRAYCRYPKGVEEASLHFELIEEHFWGREFNYVTGIVNLQKLQESGLLGRDDVFLLQIGEVVTTSSCTEEVVEAESLY